MPIWKTTVRLWDLHQKHEDGELTAAEVAKKLAERLQRNRYAYQLEDVILRLGEVEDVEDYDGCLEELYDFGDWDKRIWFECIAPKPPPGAPDSEVDPGPPVDAHVTEMVGDQTTEPEED